MKLLKSVEIEGDLWEVKEVRALSNGDTGECDFANTTIKVKRSLPFDEKICVLVHELFHAFEEYGVLVPHALIYKLEWMVARLIIKNFL